MEKNTKEKENKFKDIIDRYKLLIMYLVIFGSISMMVISDLGQKSNPTPIIIDTDFGTDIDDALAIAGIIADSEADVKMIVVNVRIENEARERANIIAKLIETMNLSIPVYYGRNIVNDDYSGVTGSGVGNIHYGTQYKYLDHPLVNNSDFRVAVADLIDQYYGKIAYIATGPWAGLADVVNYLNDTQIQGIKYAAYGVENVVTSVDTMNFPRTPKSASVVINAATNRGLNLRAVNWHLTADNTDYSGFLVGQSHCKNRNWTDKKLDAEYYLNRTNNSVGQLLTNEFWPPWIRSWQEVDPDAKSCGSHLSIQWDWFIYYATSTTDGFNRRDECTDEELFGTFRFGPANIINVKTDYIHSPSFSGNIEQWYPCYSTLGGKVNARNRLIQNIMKFEEEVILPPPPILDIITTEEYIVQKCDGEECEKYKPELPDTYGGDICFNPRDKKSLPADVNIYDKDDSITIISKNQYDKYCISGKEYARLGPKSLEINWTFVERVNDQGSWYNCTYTLYKNPADSWVIQPGDWWIEDNEFGLIFESAENVSLMIEMDCNRPIHYDKNYEYYVEQVGDVREREYTNFINCRNNNVYSTNCTTGWDEEMEENLTICPLLRTERPNCSFEYQINEINVSDEELNLTYITNVTDYTVLKNYFIGYSNGTHLTFDPEVVQRNISALVENNTRNEGEDFFHGEIENVSLLLRGEVNTTNPYDWTNNDNDGNYINDVHYTTSGHIGSGAFRLHGTNDSINVTDDNTLDFNKSENFTVCAWFNRQGANEEKSGIGFLVNKRGTNNELGLTDIGYALYFDIDPLRYLFIMDNKTFLSVRYQGETIHNNTWYHLCGIRNGTDMHIVINGTVTNTSDGTDSDITNQGSLKIGTSRTGLTHEFNGTVDEIVLYRRALTFKEIESIYNNRNLSFKDKGTTNSPMQNISNHNRVNVTISSIGNVAGNLSVVTVNYSDDSLMGFWSFNAESAVDDTGNGHDGVVTGATWDIKGHSNFYGSYHFTESQINISHSDVFNCQNFECTICFWANTSDACGTFPIHKRQKTPLTGWWFYAYSSDKSMAFTLRNISGASSTARTSFAINDGRMMYYCGVSNSTNVSLYVNGTLVAEDGLNVTEINNTMSMDIGNYDGIDSVFDWNGTIDEILYYNRSLNSTEIAELYNSRSSLYVQRDRRDVNASTNQTHIFEINRTDTFAFWKFDCQSSSNGTCVIDDWNMVAYNISTVSVVSDQLGIVWNNFSRNHTQNMNKTYSVNLTCHTSDGSNCFINATLDPEFVTRNISYLVENNTRNEGEDFIHGEVNDSTVGLFLPFDVNTTIVRDWTNNDNDGTNTDGNATWVSTGNTGGGMRFDESARLDVGTMGNFWSSAENITVTFWMNSRHDSSKMYPFGTRNSTNDPIIFGRINSNSTGDFDNGSVNFFWSDRDGDALAFATNSNTGIIDDEWHFITMDMETKVGLGNITIDGVKQNIVYYSNDSINHTNFDYPMFIGTLNLKGTPASDYFNGTLDDFTFYNRTLTLSEIQNIYNHRNFSYDNYGTLNFPTVNVSDHNQTNITISCLSEPCGNVSVLAVNYSTKDLKAYWSFNGLTSVEDSNNNQDSNATTNVNFNLSNGIRQGFMYTQNGYINISSTLTDGWREVTMCAWVKRNQSNNNYFIRKNDQIRIAGFTSSRWVFSVWNDTGSRCEIKTSDTIAFGANTWYHACLNYDSTVGVENLTGYINGVKQSNKYNKSCQGVVDTRTTMFKIGGLLATTNMNGSIDEVLLYNRSLTADEHLQLYNSYYAQKGRRNINKTNTTYHLPINTTDTFIVPYIETQSSSNSSPIYDDIHLVSDDVRVVNNKSGIIPACPDNPFCTDNDNPYTNYSIADGATVTLNWSVNATGTLWTNHTFNVSVVFFADDSVTNKTINQNVTIRSPPSTPASDVCSCAGLNTNMVCDCGVYNNITSACNLGRGNFTTNGTGDLTISANMNMSSWNHSYPTCTVYLRLTNNMTINLQ